MYYNNKKTTYNQQEIFKKIVYWSPEAEES